MILQSEIAKIAEQKEVLKSTIDKDWVLGHFINQIFNHEELSKKLVFKGGTCLKKCYFGDYRFSEDLDFTVTDSNFELTNETILSVCKNLIQATDIKLNIGEIEYLKYKNKRTGFKVDIKFWGANHSKNQVPPPPERWQTKIKLEIISYEAILFAPIEKPIIHDYSDSKLINKMAICYDLNEVISEKLRALIQRSYTAPRDYYDVWFLSKNIDFDWKTIKEAFLKKMEFKNLVFTGNEQFINDKIEISLSKHWKNSLGRHLPANHLPELDHVIKELRELFANKF